FCPYTTLFRSQEVLLQPGESLQPQLARAGEREAEHPLAAVDSRCRDEPVFRRLPGGEPRGPRHPQPAGGVETHCLQRGIRQAVTRSVRADAQYPATSDIPL